MLNIGHLDNDTVQVQVECDKMSTKKIMRASPPCVPHSWVLFAPKVLYIPPQKGDCRCRNTATIGTIGHTIHHPRCTHPPFSSFLCVFLCLLNLHQPSNRCAPSCPLLKIIFMWPQTDFHERRKFSMGGMMHQLLPWHAKSSPRQTLLNKIINNLPSKKNVE